MFIGRKCPCRPGARYTYSNMEAAKFFTMILSPPDTPGTTSLHGFLSTRGLLASGAILKMAATHMGGCIYYRLIEETGVSTEIGSVRVCA